MSRRGACVFALLFFLSGCSAAGIIASDDPGVKLQQAQDAYEHQGRFTVAQRLIQEALDISEARGDQVGVVEAYRGFGFFYRAPLSGPWRGPALIPDEFTGQVDGVARRYVLSNEYFSRAAALSATIGRHDLLSNAYFSMAQTYFLGFNDRTKACEHLELSREAQRRARAARPEGGEPVLPRGVRTFDEFIDLARSEMSCP